MLTIRVVPGAPLETNCYLVADSESGEAIIIDAPKQVAEELQQFAEELHVNVREIICTHGHWDHTMGLPELLATFSATVACHANEVDALEHPTFAPFSFPFALTPITPDRLLAAGDVVKIGRHRFTVLHTPGHTPGCICLYAAEDDTLFSGDTLFVGTFGRLDFPGGDAEQMLSSLQRLRALPSVTRVYPGHGANTTIGQEAGWLARVEELI